MGSWGYVSYVLGNVPPRALAGAVVRRAARNARQALARLQAPPSTAELLAAFGAAHPGALARQLAQPRLRAHWADRARAEELQRLAAKLPGLAERARARGQLVLEGKFEVYGHTLHFPKEIDWLADPVTGHRYDGPGTDPGLPTAGAGDPKRLWTLARMDWAVALGQAAWFATPEEAERHAERFVALTDSLLLAVPAGEGIHSAAPMEVSLRAMNLALALCMFRGAQALEGRFLLRCLRALVEHARYVLANLEDATAVPNNHLVGDLVGLLHVALLFPELPGAELWKVAALGGLRRTFPAQVLADGMGFEGSTGYHRLLLELGLAALTVARAGGVGLGEAFEPALRRMLLATRGYLTATGQAPNLGDHDGGRALALTDRAPLEHGYLPALGAALFHDARLKAPGATFPDEAAFLLGEAGLETFNRLPTTGGTGSVAYPAFGMAVLRRGETTVALSAGSTGQQGIGGHGHNDKLGIEIWSGAAPVIVDSGTWTYLGDSAGRDLFRSTAMHSTVQVDGVEQSPIFSERPFALPDLARAELLRVQRGGEREVAAGRHRGYARLPKPVNHRREVALEAAPDAVLVVDDLSGTGAHRLVSRFHLASEEVRIRALDEGERARLGRVSLQADWDVERAVEIGPAEAPLGLWVGAHGGALRLVECAYSPGYDVRVPARCIEVELLGELPVRLAAVVLLNVEPRGRPAPEPASGSPGVGS